MWKKGPGNFRGVQELGRFKTLAIGKEKKEEADTNFLFGEERASEDPNLRVFQPPPSTVNNHAGDTVERRNPASIIYLGTLSHYLPGFYTPQVVF